MKHKFLVGLTSVFTALCMMFSLAACGGTQNSGNTGDGSQTEQPGETQDGNQGGQSGGTMKPDDSAKETDFTFTQSGNVFSVTAYSGEAKNVSVPAEHDGKPVTIIGEKAFYGGAFTSITIPASVTEIRDYAFESCSSLQRVSFENNSKLTSIGGGAFCNCICLLSITIPSSVTSIGEEAFEGCSELTEIHYNGTIDAWKQIEKGSDWDNNTDEYKIYCTDETIAKDENQGNQGSGTQKPGEGQGGGTTNPDEPPTNESDFTFESVDNGFSVTAYHGTERKIVVPAEHDGKPVIAIASKAFYKSLALTSITIPEGVTSIGEKAFEDCYSLRSVSFENNSKLTSIGEAAFAGCSSLQSITIPEGVTSIGEKAFEDCYSLQEVHISDLSAWCKIQFGRGSSNPLSSAHHLYPCVHHLYLKGVEVKNLTIPSDIKEIKAYAFYGCDGLQSVTIPEGVTSIGWYAFYGCGSLRSVSFENNSKLTSIGEAAFAGCSSLQSITIPEGVTSIGQAAFQECSKLQSITIPEGVTSIGEYTFAGCSSLKSITIPNSVTLIDEWAFHECSKLTEIRYNGTIDAWYQIYKCSRWGSGSGGDWNSGTGNYTIYCTDGTIAKDGTVTKK